jgi:hypothetical protein
MTKFQTGYLPEDWEASTHIQLLSMMQNELSFWDFAIAVQAKNSLLFNTASYLEKDALHYRIESGMTQKLALQCRLEKSAKTVTFENWLMEIKRVNDLIRVEHADFEALAKSTCEYSRRMHTLSEPSHRANTTISDALSSTAVTNNTQNRVSLPKLTEVEHELLYDNEGCLKYRRIFVDHQFPNCPNNFSDATDYKALTQAWVDSQKRHTTKNWVAAVSSMMELAPIAAIIKSDMTPVAYMPSNPSSVIEEDSYL